MSEDFIEVKESLIDMYNFNKHIKVELKPLGAKAILDYIDSKDKEIEKLTNIIDGLENYLNNEQIEQDEYCDFFIKDKQIKVENVLNKLKELKGSDE